MTKLVLAAALPAWLRYILLTAFDSRSYVLFLSDTLHQSIPQYFTCFSQPTPAMTVKDWPARYMQRDKEREAQELTARRGPSIFRTQAEKKYKARTPLHIMTTHVNIGSAI